VSCGATHSHARELVREGYQTALVAATLLISRSSLYYRQRIRRSRADRRYDELIIAACGEKPTFGYRRVTLRLQRKQKLRINHKRVLLRLLRARRRKEGGAWKLPSQIRSGSRT
jgi:hypothetical protein